MKRVILSAESTCDLSAELKERYHVHTLPFHVELGEDTYLDGVDLHPDMIYERYQSDGILPKTAAINIVEYTEYFRPFVEAGCEVVHFCLGSALSSSYQNCCLAASELPGVYVIDSCNLSTGIGLLVLEAADRIEAGMEAAQVAAEVRELVPLVSASFVVDNLEFLCKSGRCSALTMMGANMLSIKPSIVVDPADGSMGVGKKYRGSLEKVLKHYVEEKLSAGVAVNGKRAFVTHSGIGEEILAQITEQVQKTELFEEVFVTRAGCTISSHCGPNTLGVLFLKKP